MAARIVVDELDLLLEEAGRRCWPGCSSGLADSDVLSPRDVFWWYHASPVWTLRCLLTLPEPGHPEAPRMPIRVCRR